MLSLVSSWYVVFHLHVPRPTSSSCPEIDCKTEAQKGGHLYLGIVYGTCGTNDKKMKKT